MKRFESINVIPFIDIMLVLLAIVLTTATFIAQGKLEIRLPEAKNQIQGPAETPIEIAIDQQERIYLDQEPIELDILDQRLAAVDPANLLVLRVDGRVSFGRFVTLVDLLKSHRLERLSILTQQAK